MRLSMPTLLRRPWDALGIGCAVVYGVPSLWYPHGGDQSIHWYIGKGLLLGEAPYVTGISTKPPGAFVVHALSILLFGDYAHSIRILDLAFLLGCGALVAVLARERLRDGDIGAACLLTSGVYFSYFDYSDTAHPELWESFFALAAAAWALRHKNPVRAALWVGLASGISISMKYPSVLICGVAGLWCVARAYREGAPQTSAAWTRVGAATASGLVGGGLVVAACILPFVLQGHWETLREAMYEAIVYYKAHPPKAPEDVDLPPWLLLSNAGYFAMGACASGAIALGWSFWSRSSGGRDAMKTSLLAWALFAAAVLGAFWQNRFWLRVFDYHWVVTTPFFALLVFLALTQFASRGRLFISAAALCGAMFLNSAPWSHSQNATYRTYVRSWSRYVLGGDGRSQAASRENFLSIFSGMYPLDRYNRMRHVGHEVARRAVAGDTLCVDGFATQVYFVAKLRCTSRHFVEATLYQYLPRWRAEHNQTLRTDPPTFVVTFSDRWSTIRTLALRGYRRTDLRDRWPVHYVVMERKVVTERK